MDGNCLETVEIMYYALLGVTWMIENRGCHMRTVLEQHGTEGQVESYEAMVCVLCWLRNEIADVLLPGLRA